MEKKRGRPRNAESTDRERQDDARNDEVIARSVGRLIGFGFPQRGDDGVYATVANCAREVLARVDRSTSTRLPLSADRIEQIYEAWRMQDFRRQWARKNFTKDSLQNRVPNTYDGVGKRSLADLATELLLNGGYLRKTVLDTVTYIDPWTGEEKEMARYVEDMIGHRDAVMTPKAHAECVENWIGVVGAKRGN